MDLIRLYNLFANNEFDVKLKGFIKNLTHHEVGAVTSVAGSSASFLLTSIYTNIKKNRKLIVIGESADDAGYLYHDLSKFIPESNLLFLPSAFKRDIKFGQIDPPSLILRNDALTKLNNTETSCIVVTYPEGIAEKVESHEIIEDNSLFISADKPLNLTETKNWLLDKGFNMVDYVYEPGQFAIRGSILDVFSYNNELPYRIDLFDDDVDSIRIFNIETQLSVTKIDSFTISANLDNGRSSGISLLEFIGSQVVVAVRDYDNTVKLIKESCNKEFSNSSLIAQEGDSTSINRLLDFNSLNKSLCSLKRFDFTSQESSSLGKVKNNLDLHCSAQKIFHKNFDILAQSLHEYLDKGYKICILSENEKQFKRLHDIFEERGEKLDFISVDGILHEGFVDHLSKICVLTDHQIFDRFHKYSLKSDKARSGKLALTMKELASIETGDYIVHIDHGIGKFGGLLKTDVNGRAQEMIKLIYQNNDVIFVSIHSLHKLAKYKGKEGEQPKINKLGTGAWNKLKERTKDKLKDIARDLIKLYAARREEKGFSYSPDSYLQQELEASFIYEDTPDQQTATQSVKADMESSRPMDRLICGDVGFGKTEIAIRAAFKAANDNKQTAILVPTTVLAFQHYNTFRERLADFPVRVEFLSRAKTPKQVKEILSDLKDGKIDIIIGTHKLIGPAVQFKDLGLLVIDEEQKFGVAVKEKLKQLKVNVDTLTMSATPIPRTLQFSLMGARDLSALTTPPPNRQPIVTNLGPLNDNLLSEAINFELSRNGQVFIINNRIEGLYDLQEQIRRLIPDARTLVAHGQMPPDKLEEAIIAFNNHDYDILLATTIIESGVDMPNVNTIIINNAQNFGLSELHQLRGRVGRSSRKAFCYLAVPPHIPLTPVAKRRLQAIESFSELGSGIHISMQDLDIRGAGNLLGAEQSGFIADLGYETYQKVLKEAVLELKTQEFAQEFAQEIEESEKGFAADCTIESDLELMFPYDYVPQMSERISLYKELDSIETDSELNDFRKNLEDRFGKIPYVAEELIRVPKVRTLARRLGIEKIVLKKDNMYLHLVDQSNMAYYQSPMFGKIINYATQQARNIQFRDNDGKRSIVVKDIKSVEKAVDVLNEMISLESI